MTPGHVPSFRLQSSRPCSASDDVAAVAELVETSISLERDIEDHLVNHLDAIERGLTLVGRQVQAGLDEERRGPDLDATNVGRAIKAEARGCETLRDIARDVVV